MKPREALVLNWLLFRDITSLNDFCPSSNNYVGTICHAVTIEDQRNQFQLRLRSFNNNSISEIKSSLAVINFIKQHLERKKYLKLLRDQKNTVQHEINRFNKHTWNSR